MKTNNRQRKKGDVNEHLGIVNENPQRKMGHCQRKLGQCQRTLFETYNLKKSVRFI